MHIKNKIRFHKTLTKMAKKNKTDCISVDKDVEQLELHTLGKEMLILYALCKVVWQFLKKLNTYHMSQLFHF